MTRNILDKVSTLQATDLFGSLAEPILLTIAAASTTRTLSRGEILYSEKEEASTLYVVARGELRSIRQSIDGREQVLSTEHAGSILAAVAIFGGGNFYTTVIAETKAEILTIGKREVLELCRTHPEILWKLARVLAQRLRHSAELIENLALRHVDQRVAQYLLTICQQRGIGDQFTCIVELTMSRTEIAGRLGSAREVVSRAFTQLEKTQLIQIRGRRLITIPDMRALRVFAGSDVPMREAEVTLNCSWISLNVSQGL